MKTVAFEFIGVQDCGSTTCPHCGADGRYIYSWSQNGVKYAAMAGCYKQLTGHIQKDDEAKYMEVLAKKIAKGEALNGWDKRVLGLKKSVADGKVTPEWARGKVFEVLSERKAYLAKHRF